MLNEPWKNEPDKLHWVDEATDLDCLIVRNDLGALCGYVGITKGNQYFEKEYNEVPVDVHGGLTYSAFCNEGGKICHVPLPGRSHRVWWLGFDCGHWGDLIPGMLKYGVNLGDRYRDIEYVKKECRNLALQLNETTKNPFA